MKSNPESASYWRQHIDALKDSGLTRKAYCEKNQIKISTLDYWRKKLSASNIQGNRAKEAGWIPLQLGEDETSGIDLRIGQITVSVKPGFDSSLLTELLRTIGTLC
jgi:hypothetical protein